MSVDSDELLATHYNRIGVERLWRTADGRYLVSLDNRTYHNRFVIPPEKVPAWRRVFGLPDADHA